MRKFDVLFLKTKFNVLCLNPRAPDSVPQELLLALTEYISDPLEDGKPSSSEARLRQQMRRDALQPLDDDEVDDGGVGPETILKSDVFSEEMIEQAKIFLALSVSLLSIYPRFR